MNQPANEVAPFVGRPPLDRIGTAGSGTSVLLDYVEHRTRRWGGVPVPFPGPVSAALWSVLIMNAGLGAWLALVLLGTTPCAGPVCSIVTWGHPVPLLVLAASCVAVLAGATVVTRGLSEAGAVPLCLVLLGAACGVAAMSGLIALVLIVLAALAMAMFVLATVVDRL